MKVADLKQGTMIQYTGVEFSDDCLEKDMVYIVKIDDKGEPYIICKMDLPHWLGDDALLKPFKEYNPDD